MNKDHLRLVTNDDFYQKLRGRIRGWAKGRGRGHKALEYVLLAPDMFHLLVKLNLDGRVPPGSKLRLGVALAYFISPLDLLPEALLGPIGYLDDIAVAAWALDGLVKDAGPDLVVEHWAGEGDALETIAKIIAATNDLIGAGLARRIKAAFDRQDFTGPALGPAGTRGKLTEGE